MPFGFLLSGLGATNLLRASWLTPTAISLWMQLQRELSVYAFADYIESYHSNVKLSTKKSIQEIWMFFKGGQTYLNEIV